MAGALVTLSSKPTGFDKKHPVTYVWTSSGGTIQKAHNQTTTLDTSGLSVGTYTASLAAANSNKHQSAQCQANFVVNFPAPVVTCVASPPTVEPGAPSTITVSAHSSDNVGNSSYSYEASAGTTSSASSSAILDTADASPGLITVKTTAVNQHGLSGTCSTAVKVDTLWTPEADLGSPKGDPNQYGYYPGNSLSLGAGINPDQPTVFLLPCVLYEKETLPGGSTGTVFTSYYVTNAQQLKSVLSIDQNMDATYLTFKGSGSFNLSEESTVTSDTATLVIMAHSGYPGIQVKAGTVSLTPQAKALLANNAEFVRVCGTRWVGFIDRGSSVSAIVTFSGLSLEESTKISTALSASGGWGVLSGSAKTAANSALSRAAQAHQISIQVVATGGPGFGPAADLMAAAASPDPNPIDKIQAQLAPYLNQFTAENSAPLIFKVVSMEGLGWDPTHASIWSDLQERESPKPGPGI